MAGQTEHTGPWWLWPHLLGLDAPLVAVVWQRWWARCAGVTLAAHEEVVLGLGVWMIYLADRLTDVARGEAAQHGTARHHFHGRWRGALGGLTACVAVLAAAVALGTLSGDEFRAGLGLLGMVGAYFWFAHHRLGRRGAALLPKEAVVGGIFALGSAFFVLGKGFGSQGSWTHAVPGFAVLCFLNCGLITKWERSLADARDPASLPNAFPRLTARLGMGCLLLAGWALAAAAVARSAALLPVAAAALGLALLDRWRASIPADTLRVLADVVLLAPLVWIM